MIHGVLLRSRAVNRLFNFSGAASGETDGRERRGTGVAGVSASAGSSGTGADGVDYRWRTHRWPAEFSSTFT